ncbi:hypothetical protein INT47_002788 [Mucor saturninus]|uniref:RING-type domain-containing protein n=1 Tax=Mucor saturninus TaxID=64648 RepID=A0A8H7QXR3_9FUNG|nr:hypothetical protein INT47_002788 [Mucor saturninus]
MGQSPSAASSRHDNASTRTLHSASMRSNRPLSFFRRISNRLSTHPNRRSGQQQLQQQQQQQQQQQRYYQGQRSVATLHTFSTTTSSVRQATQEAARAAAAATGPPFLLHHQQQNPVTTAQSRSSRRTSVTSLSDSTASWNEFLSRDTDNGSSMLRYLQIPIRASTVTTEGESAAAAAVGGAGTMEQQQTSSTTASLNTTRRMHILVIEYRSSTSSPSPPPPPPRASSPSPPPTIASSPPPFLPPTTPLPPPPLPPPTRPLPPPPSSQSFSASPTGSQQYRFLGLRRRRSQVSSHSSTDTIMSHYPNINPTSPEPTSGQWVVYVMNSTTTILSSSSVANAYSVMDDNPTYEDLLWLSNRLGPARPCTTTQAAVDAAIPVLDWSDQMKKDVEACLVCLDEFENKQPVRVLKCHHVFHRECVDRWLCESHNSCPVCRRVPVETSSS